IDDAVLVVAVAFDVDGLELHIVRAQVEDERRGERHFRVRIAGRDQAERNVTVGRVLIRDVVHAIGDVIPTVAGGVFGRRSGDLAGRGAAAVRAWHPLYVGAGDGAADLDASLNRDR